jgi:chromosome segregation ATPase
MNDDIRQLRAGGFLDERGLRILDRLQAEVERLQRERDDFIEARRLDLEEVEKLRDEATRIMDDEDRKWKAEVESLRNAVRDAGRMRGLLEEARAEVERLRSGQWTDEERKLFLFEATKASYAEGVRAGCEELSIHAADMDVELEELHESYDQLVKSEDTLRQVNANLEEANAAVVAERDEARGEVERLRNENDGLQADLDERLAEVERLRTEIARYKADPTLLLAVDESKVIYFPEEKV